MDSKAEVRQFMRYQNRLHRKTNVLMLVVSLLVNLAVLISLNLFSN